MSLSGQSLVTLSPELERAVFLGVAFLTHAAVGYALVAAITDADPRLGLVFGLLPDTDFLFPEMLGFPFVHRGITHTPLFAVGVIVAVALFDREWTIAVAVSLGSHLCIDGLSPEGVMWLYPLTRAPSPGLDVHGPAGTVVLWIVVAGLLWMSRELPKS